MTALMLTGCGRAGQNPSGTTRIPTTPAQTTSTAGETSTSTPTPSPSAPPAPDAAYNFGYQSLWPFTEQASAEDWLRESKSRGDQPWHGDPSATAVKFAQEFLGFAELNRTTTVSEKAREAWIGVGQNDPNGQPRTVATLHLVRLGPAPDAPWEVVGTEDTDLTLDTPRYGSPMSRPVIAAGGMISGVDESLHLKALQPGTEIAEFCCVSAGGPRSPWSAQMRVAENPLPGAVTIVVWTGGHYADIEGFAVTGVTAA